MLFLKYDVEFFSRDGSAVELVGLCKSIVSWLHDCHSKGLYPHAGVEATVNGKFCKLMNSLLEAKNICFTTLTILYSLLYSTQLSHASFISGFRGKE